MREGDTVLFQNIRALCAMPRRQDGGGVFDERTNCGSPLPRLLLVLTTTDTEMKPRTVNRAPGPNKMRSNKRYCYLGGEGRLKTE